MTDQLISFETAKLAKEKECDLESKDYYIGQHPAYPIYTQSLLQKWLREIHNIHIIIKPFWDDREEKITWAADIMQIGNYIAKNKRLQVQFTYEEALEQGLRSSLKLIP